MKLDKFYKLKNQFEFFSFEKNFNALSKTLYYFSFLGNIFLILFSYFFIKDVTNSIPILFTGQGLFFSVFVILFMTGYELFKRFAFEQLTATILKVKKATTNIVLGVFICLSLVCGSFYLSLNGAHRLIDTSAKVESKLDTVQSVKTDSIAFIYNQRIEVLQNQLKLVYDNNEDGKLSAREKRDISKYEIDIKDLEKDRDQRIADVENKINSKLNKTESKISENGTAFAIMVFFLEFIILIGVAFASYYKYNSFVEMKTALSTPKFKQLELNIKLLKLFYQKGRKKEGDITLTKNKLVSLVFSSKVNCSKKDIDNFITLCIELDVITNSKRNKTYLLSYDKAYELLESQEWES